MSRDAVDPHVASLEAVIAEMREREADHRRFPGVPCQCESIWHADELKGWADRLAGLAASGAPDAGVSTD